MQSCRHKKILSRTGILFCFFLFIAVCPCLSNDIRAKKEAPATKSQAQQTKTKSFAIPLSTKFFEVMAKLETLSRPFQDKELEPLLGCKLGPDDVHSSAFHCKGFEKRLFTDVEVDRPTPDAPLNRLCLTIDCHLCPIKPAQILAKYGKAEFIPDRSSTCVFDPAHIEYLRSWGKLIFAFTRERKLDTISFWLK